MSSSQTSPSAEEIRRLLERLGDLSEDERALLLALAELDQETGHALSPEAQRLLEALAASLRAYDPAEIRAAVRRMVHARPQSPGERWPADLRRGFRGRRKP